MALQQLTEFACPNCGGQITSGPSGIICSKDSQHRWNDTMAFYGCNPQMKYKVEPPKALPQEHHEPYSISLPIGVGKVFSEKFGDQAGVTIASVLMQLVEGNVMIVGQTDLDRLGLHLGKVPDSAGELVGMAYALKEQVTEQKQMAEQALTDLKAYEGLTRGSVVVNLGDQYENAVAKARDAQLPLKLFVENAVKSGLENSWF